MSKNKAIILLSGGLDSATVLAIALNEGKECHALTFTYGQRHWIELNNAREIAAQYGLTNHVIVELPAYLFSTSALSADSDISVPKNNNPVREGIPATYVPARNILFLSYALAFGEAHSINEIYIGVNAIDYSGYPDCRPEFIKAFENMANIGTQSGVEGRHFTVKTPLISLKKSEIIKLGAELHVDYSMTHSCYDPDKNGLACGYCDSCLLRKKGFKEAGITDPTRYAK